jgi:hypothetical protein
MIEIAIPICILLGIKNINTIGWDGPKNKIYEYFNDKKNLIDFNSKKIILEYDFIVFLDEILKKYGIKLFKLSNNSHINLKYKNILLN